MSKFRVTLAQDCTESGVVIVEADSNTEAEEKALDGNCLPDDFEFTYDDGNDYTKSRYVASTEERFDVLVTDCLANVMRHARMGGLDVATMVQRASNNFNEEVLGIDDA